MTGAMPGRFTKLSDTPRVRVGQEGSASCARDLRYVIERRFRPAAIDTKRNCLQRWPVQDDDATRPRHGNETFVLES
jgi:hypothetical protein